MDLLVTILLVFALVLCILAAFRIPAALKPHLGWLGVACAIGAWLLTHVKK